MSRWREEDGGTWCQFCCDRREYELRFESNMNSSVPAAAQCHYTQGCSRMKTQSLHEERHETVTQNPMKCVVNETEIDEPNVAMAA
jgi:hypothetical protein